MRLLLVEDDPTISSFLVRGLREDHHLVDLLSDGSTVAELVKAEEYDAILLDIMLPGLDGFQACRQLRQQGVDTPVLVISARDSVADRVHGLDCGADDYLVKPFAFDELLARLRALGRRGRSRHQTGVLRYGPIEVDPTAHSVTVHGQQVALSATEYRLVEFLVRRAESIVSRDQLSQHVWGGDAEAGSNVIDVYVGYVRRKLLAIHPRALIQTVRGLGYMLKEDAA